MEKKTGEIAKISMKSTKVGREKKGKHRRSGKKLRTKRVLLSTTFSGDEYSLAATRWRENVVGSSLKSLDGIEMTRITSISL